jgi:hypothetical protein
MTARGENSVAMMLIAYERLTDHGLALPLFASSAAANALHVAVPSRPGDPQALIRAFDVYSPTESENIDPSQFRSVAEGEIWTDVFIWRDTAHVGTRAALWEGMEAWRTEIERKAPLTLLALAEGVGHVESARCADLAYHWLAEDWGRKRADRWRVDSYLTRLARRDLLRCYDTSSLVAEATEVAERMRLTQRGSVLELRSPRLLELRADDLPELANAVDALGWRLEIVFEDTLKSKDLADNEPSPRAMVMRLRHGRGRTQTQIPLRVVDEFFAGSRTLRNARTGQWRTMTLSKAGDRRNTMKLQLPEIAQMTDPVAHFEHREEGVVFEVYDASSTAGHKIANLLDDGVRNGSTRKTQRGATWWRLLPSKPQF